MQRFSHVVCVDQGTSRQRRAVSTKGSEIRTLLFDEHSVRSRVEDALTRAKILLQRHLTQLGATLGTSSVIANSSRDFTQVLLDARQVCTFNSLREHGPQAENQPDPSLGASLLAHDDKSRSTLQDTILAPLTIYDRNHQTDLVRTLDVFLSTCGQWNTSANKL